MITNEEKRIFGENVLNLRREHGLSQRELAKIMGIGVKSLRRIEKGDLPKRFYLGHLVRLVEYFEISADALFYPMENADA